MQREGITGRRLPVEGRVKWRRLHVKRGDNVENAC